MPLSEIVDNGEAKEFSNEKCATVSGEILRL